MKNSNLQEKGKKKKQHKLQQVSLWHSRLRIWCGGSCGTGHKMWCWFDPWPGNFHMSQMWPREKSSKFQISLDNQIGAVYVVMYQQHSQRHGCHLFLEQSFIFITYIHMYDIYDLS